MSLISSSPREYKAGAVTGCGVGVVTLCAPLGGVRESRPRLPWGVAAPRDFFLLAITSILRYIASMRKQIAISINEVEAKRLDALLNGRSAYAFTLEALRDKMTREEGANK